LSLASIANSRHKVHFVVEFIITDSGTEVAVIISMTDYERLHEHADVADALRLRTLRASTYNTMSLADMLEALGLDVDTFATP